MIQNIRRLLFKQKRIKIQRFYSSSNNKQNNQSIENLLDSEYQKKTLAFPCDLPIFNYNPMSIEFSSDKLHFIEQYLKFNNYATIIYPKKENQIDLNQLENFQPLGNFCKIEKQSDNKIHFQSITKVELTEITSFEVQRGDESLKKYFGQNFNIQPEKENKIQTQNKEQSEQLGFVDKFSDKLFVSQFKDLQDMNFDELDIEQRVKIDNLIDLAKNISKTKNINQNINYMDIDEFLDNLAIISLQTGIFDHQQILALYASRSFNERLEEGYKIIKKIYIFYNKMKDIGKMAERNIQMKKHKEFSNEIYNIVKNIAEKNQKSKLDKLADQFYKDKNPPKHVVQIFEENYNRLKDLNQSYPEYNVIMNYLKWVACLPYGLRSQEDFDLQKAQEILDNDHYGLTKAKERVLEFLAVGKLKNNVKGKILCLQGPPGVGKTSFAHSVARVLNRKVYRVSLGGENDVSVLKGHRKTYVASRPGKIVEALKQSKTENCVIIIDEIDKTAQGSVFGDPQSTLLEILDPEQNNSFVDNFLDYPIDLSNVFFICTANNLNTISQPLLDRMDIIELHSYTNQEKKHIFYDFMIKKAIENTGLNDYQDSFEIKDEVIQTLIDGYCREAGVRSLQKNTNKILEKIGYEIIKELEKKEEKEEEKQLDKKLIVDNSNIVDYLGQPLFEKNSLYQKLIPGVVKGLAYNGMGGSVLYIESTIGSHKKFAKGLKLTGNLGDVMKESMNIAYSYARYYLKKINNKFLEDHMIHIHVPEGAMPKDGPSAGVAITSSLLSLALQKTIKDQIGMTGEISLKGQVLKIGGLKEKILAAKREGLRKLIIPFYNKEDIEEFDNDVIENIDFCFVKTYEDVSKVLFVNQFLLQNLLIIKIFE